jgi:hypothetical protein
LPISANPLDDVTSGSESNFKSPTRAVHSICALQRRNLPAKPPPSVGSSSLSIVNASHA